MNQGLTSKIEKARRYADQKERIKFDSFSVSVSGDHNAHTVDFKRGSWGCDCHYFNTRGYCSHTMAMERVLDEMLPPTEA